jgi:hypothetical protein
VLDLGDEVFAFERKSIDGSQTLLCLFNFLSIEAKIDQQEILSVYFPDGQVKDLISGGEFSIKDSFALRPYQSLWLCTN